MAAINNDWLDALKGEFKKPYYKKLFETVNEEYRTRQIFPPADDIFNAFHLTPLHNVKAVRLGQESPDFFFNLLIIYVRKSYQTALVRLLQHLLCAEHESSDHFRYKYHSELPLLQHHQAVGCLPLSIP